MSIARFDGASAYVNPSYGKPPKPLCICWSRPHAKDCPRYRAPSDDRVKYSDTKEGGRGR